MFDTSRLSTAFVEKRMDEVLFSVVLNRGDEPIADGTARFYFSENHGRHLVSFYGRFRDQYDATWVSPFQKDQNKLVVMHGVTACGFWGSLSLVLLEEVGSFEGNYNILFEPLVVRFSRSATKSSDGLFDSDYFSAEIDPISLDFSSSLPLVVTELSFCFQQSGITLYPGNARSNTLVIHGTDRDLSFRILKMLTDSLSLLLGKHCDALAISCKYDGNEELILHPEYLNRNRGNTPLLPIWPERSNIEQFLLKSLVAFSDHDTGQLRRFHGYLVDTYRLDYYSKEMATGIAVAGMAEYLIEHYADEDKAQLELKQKQYKKFVNTVKKNIHELVELDDFKRRAKLELFGRYETAKERVRRAGEIVDVRLEESDLTKWVKMRNKAAHPDFEDLSYDARNDRLEASLNIFFQLLRGYIQWDASDNVHLKTEE